MGVNKSCVLRHWRVQSELRLSAMRQSTTDVTVGEIQVCGFDHTLAGVRAACAGKDAELFCENSGWLRFKFLDQISQLLNVCGHIDEILAENADLSIYSAKAARGLRAKLSDLLL